MREAKIQVALKYILPVGELRALGTLILDLNEELFSEALFAPNLAFQTVTQQDKSGIRRLCVDKAIRFDRRIRGSLRGELRHYGRTRTPVSARSLRTKRSFPLIRVAICSVPRKSSASRP